LITGPTTINATNTLHAVWWVNPIITFNAQGGSPTPPQQRPAHGGVIVQPASPTLLNHTFRHWSETPGGATAWNFATTTTIDRTLHAVWWVNPTITFNTHGGTPTPAQQRPAHGGRIIEPAQNPTLSGHNFRHWSATPNGATPWNFDHTVTTNQTLHAVWDIMIWRTINFRIGNPLNNTAVTFAFSVEYLSTLYFRNHIPIEQDLVFLGWATSAENARNKVIVHTSAGTMQVVNNTTLYAVWDINWDHFPGLDGHNTMMLNFTGGINPDQSGGIVRVERQFWSWDPLSRWLPSTEYMHAWEAEREPSPQHRRTFLGWFDNSAGTGTPRTSIPSTHSGPIEFWAIWTI
ncbi:MAG: InlB B-repeat-containing protein, partial [Firmicutes bacterium]|nr:InlB B-repeat-containing protein [Bacillota bacterium]